MTKLNPAARIDVYADMRSQMYEGVRVERTSTNMAIAATSGQVLSWHGEVAETYYSSTSGGRTAASSDAWPGARRVRYLTSVSDPYDAISPYHRWRPRVLTASELAARLHLRNVRDVRATTARSGWV